jgi:hypothetical protein
MLNQPQSPRATDRPRRRLGDAGYAVALTALLLLPMLGFTALAVDLGSWYARAGALQRATDAAALAGVTALPDGGRLAAEQVAIAVAAQNGFVADNARIVVTVNQVGADRIQVTITDNNVPQYFSRVFRGSSNVVVTRSAIAEYVPPVRMGSPRNFLGTHFLPGFGEPEGFALSASSNCSPAEDGDLLLPRRAAMFPATGSASTGSGTSPTSCEPSGSIQNPTWDTRGYLYGVAFDEEYGGGQVTLEVFNPYLCGSSPYAGEIGGAAFNTIFTVRAPNIDPFAGTPVATSSYGADCTSRGTPSRPGGGWMSLGNINPTGGDMYAIQVQTSGATAPGWFNNFALRARRAGAPWQACSNDPEEMDSSLDEEATGIAPEDCPNVFAYNHMSIYADASGPSVDGYINATFFLASIGQEHSGKTLVIDLFDPGEGGHDIRLLDPNGAHHTAIQWEVVPRYESEVPAARTSGSTSPIDVSGGGPSATGQPQPGDRRSTRTYTFNDRQLRIRLTLPDNIQTAYGGRTWWRLRYRFNPGQAVNDRTTWSVNVLGDPVRLIE